MWIVAKIFGIALIAKFGLDLYSSDLESFDAIAGFCVGLMFFLIPRHYDFSPKQISGLVIATFGAWCLVNNHDSYIEIAICSAIILFGLYLAELLDILTDDGDISGWGSGSDSDSNRRSSRCSDYDSDGDGGD